MMSIVLTSVALSCLTSFLAWESSMIAVLLLGLSMFREIPLHMNSFQSIFSFLMVLLTWAIFFIILMNESNSWEELMSSKYWKLQFILMALIYMFFLTDQMIVLYCSFEASLLPLALIILGWGYQPERISASFSMMVYMLFSSFPLLAIILVWLESSSVLSLAQTSNVGWGCGGESPLTSLIFFASMASFLVKFPMYGLHMWLPKAHVEAPLSGSMVLAGILLKMGGYGMFLFSVWAPVTILEDSLAYVSLVGGIIVTFLCLRQVDLKVLVAYFSVSHMSLCISCALMQHSMTSGSMLLILVSHGLCSAGLFAGVNVMYNMSNSRNLLLNGGFLGSVPYFSKVVFFLVMGNMATPPTLNFLGEVLSITYLLNCLPLSAILLVLPLMLGIVASIFLYVSGSYGHLASHTMTSQHSAMLSSMTLSFALILIYWLTLLTNLAY